MEINSKKQTKSKYIRAPIRIEVPHMEDMQSRKNPFKKSSQNKTLKSKRSGTLVDYQVSSEGRVHAKTFITSQGPLCPTFLVVQRHETLISDTIDSISEDDCEWIFDEQVKPGSEESQEELKMEEYGKYEMTREIQYNFNIMRFLNKPTLEEVKAREVELGLAKTKRSKVLALDLDETLIHMMSPRLEYSTMNVCYGSAQTVLFKDPESQTFNSIKVIIRPHALKLLKELSLIYEIVVLL
jgi:hypothetical protein